ncbi:RPA-related protein RADX isoform X2 [Engraulis encrasicolus]|uniref:RPA-related protein RADX isoform X2 n=1 Tax=Engraulis encrasicolus TaxID=184585 RepID=UPI002FCE779B
MASSAGSLQHPSCALERVLRKLSGKRADTGHIRTCQELLYVLSVDRYTRDANFAVYFQRSINATDSLYDATLTDGDCKVRVSVEPRLNNLIEKNILRCGSTIKNVELYLEENTEGGSVDILVTNLEVDQSADQDAALRALSGVNVKTLPWCAGGAEPSPLPLRSRRGTYLPLWTDNDFFGEMWRDQPPENARERNKTGRPVTLREVRHRFLTDGKLIRGDIRIRILQKSRLMHYGKTDQSCLYPYRAELQVADGSASVTAVLWNSMCVEWYRRLHPGMVLHLSHFRVRESFSHRMGQNPERDIEISLNSSHPEAIISIVSSVSPDWCLPDVPHHFCKGSDLQSIPHGSICDVLGLVIFVGRPECTQIKDRKMDIFRWIQLEDGSSDQPIMVKLYSTSQPDVHSAIQPMAVFVCTRLKLVKGSEFYYLTNTQYTQLYCTGTGRPLTIPYKGIRPFRQFLQWLDQMDENDVMNRSVVGGYFIFPPPPSTLTTFMEEWKEQSGLLRGDELRVRCEKLRYRESQRFCVQCTIGTVEYHHQDDTHLSFLSSSSLTAPTSPGDLPQTRRTPRPQKRPNPITAGTPKRRRCLPSSEPEEVSESDLSLFDSALEFLIGDERDLDAASDEDGDNDSFFSVDTSPSTSPFSLSQAAMETIPRSFCFRRRHVQASATGLQPSSFQKLLPFEELDSFSPAKFYHGHYTLQLRVLSDRVVLNALFFPASVDTNHWRPLPQTHANSWESILSHGGFSPHIPNPSPVDLMATRSQLANQKFVCVLEACSLGRNRLELVLSRAFLLQS